MLTAIDINSFPVYSFDMKEFILRDIIPVLLTSLFIYNITRRSEQKDYQRRSTESIISELGKVYSRLSVSQATFLNKVFLLDTIDTDESSEYRLIYEKDLNEMIEFIHSYKESVDNFYNLYVRSRMIGISKHAINDYVFLYQYYEKIDLIFDLFMDELHENENNGLVPEKLISELNDKCENLFMKSNPFLHFNNLIFNLSIPFIKVNIFQRIKALILSKKVIREINKDLNKDIRRDYEDVGQVDIKKSNDLHE